MQASFALFAAALLAIAMTGAPARAQTDTAFTYQGRLDLAGAPYTGTADYRFTLWTSASAGNQVGAELALDGTDVDGGLFTADLDFGAEAIAGQRWLAISVRTPSWDGQGDEPVFTTLEPRQQVTRAPYAIQTRGIHVDDDGNVAIGYPNTLARLSMMDVGQTDDIPLITFSENQVNNEFNFMGDFGGGGPTGNSLRLSTLWTSNAMTWRGDGNVGIGTTTPQSRLHLGSGDLRFPDGTTQTTAYRPIVDHAELGSFVVPGGGQNALTLSIAGAQPGMAVIVTPVDYDLWSFHTIGFARVSAANTVRFSIVSAAGGDKTYSAATWRITVLP